MNSANADRNLLCGILALQMDFICRDALIAAMNAWVLDKSKSLGQILQDQHALSGDAYDLLSALVQKHLQMHGDDPGKSLAALNRATRTSLGSANKGLEDVADADVRASLQRTSVLAEDPYASKAPVVGAPTSAGRFRVLRPHAKGGLGQVAVAFDEELHREVALKEIQDRYADDAVRRARFLMEAEITGGLEHPGIVPVYGLGQYSDGRPYYAMRLIKGDSFKDAIERYHSNDGKAGAAAKGLELRELLRRFIDVCNAIAYAHSRGVLHRDVKPANVMLGKYGETLVVDWGLAKPQGGKGASPAADEQPLLPSQAGGPLATLAGSALGTPQFMSPEQASGRLDQLGPASDIYGLGATLYCLLTGKPPFTDADLGTLLKKVQRGDFPPPRQLKRTVPTALEAICLKAMALKPQERYPSPLALADDVERWLADELATAYRESWTERASRWVGRHRRIAVAIVAALLIALVSLTVTAAQLNQAKTVAERREQKARERFTLAHRTVDRFYTTVSESPEMKENGVEKLRTKLLDEAVEYYQQVVKEEETQPEPDRTSAYYRLLEDAE